MRSTTDITDEIISSLDKAKALLNDLSMFYSPRDCAAILHNITRADILAIELTKNHSTHVRNISPNETADGLRAIRDAELKLRDAFTLINPAVPDQ